jgi:hypothetical protein
VQQGTDRTVSSNGLESLCHAEANEGDGVNGGNAPRLNMAAFDRWLLHAGSGLVALGHHSWGEVKGNLLFKLII